MVMAAIWCTDQAMTALIDVRPCVYDLTRTGDPLMTYSPAVACERHRLLGQLEQVLDGGSEGTLGLGQRLGPTAC